MSLQKESRSLMSTAAQALSTTFYFPEKHVKTSVNYKSWWVHRFSYAQNSLDAITFLVNLLFTHIFINVYSDPFWFTQLFINICCEPFRSHNFSQTFCSEPFCPLPLQGLSLANVSAHSISKLCNKYEKIPGLTLITWYLFFESLLSLKIRHATPLFYLSGGTKSHMCRTFIQYCAPNSRQF
jgi:hypothetical protein